jgi:hypothetical protein
VVDDVNASKHFSYSLYFSFLILFYFFSLLAMSKTNKMARRHFESAKCALHDMTIPFLSFKCIMSVIVSL